MNTDIDHELISLLSKAEIFSYLSPLALSADALHIFPTITSTNDYLLLAAKDSSQKTMACLAEQQTEGRGQKGRPWVSPFAKNLHCSLLWRFPKNQDLSGLSLVMGLAILNTLKRFGVDNNIGIKWPNDILYKSKKLSGILIELNESQGNINAVIGIGINVNMPNISGEAINQPWTDLHKITGKFINRSALAGILLNKVLQNLKQFQNDGFSFFINDWQQNDLTVNQLLNVVTPNASFAGIGRGVNDKGQILIEVSQNNIQSFASGEVSLRIQT